MSAAFFTRSSNRTEKTVALTQMAGAYHAAGHAVANIVQGLDLHPVTVPVNGQHNGVVVDHERVAELRPTHELHAETFALHRQALLEKKVRSYLAGRIAQRRFSPRSWRSHHDSGDQQRAIELLLRASGDSERTATAWMRLSVDSDRRSHRAIMAGGRGGRLCARDPSGFATVRGASTLLEGAQILK